MFHELRTKVQVFTRKHTSDVSSIARSLGVVGGGGGGADKKTSHSQRASCFRGGVVYLCSPFVQLFHFLFVFFVFSIFQNVFWFRLGLKK